MKSKKNKILAATACGVIVTSIGASFLFNKPNEDKAEDIKKDIEEIENNETEELAEEIENTEESIENIIEEDNNEEEVNIAISESSSSNNNTDNSTTSNATNNSNTATSQSTTTNNSTSNSQAGNAIVEEVKDEVSNNGGGTSSTTNDSVESTSKYKDGTYSGSATGFAGTLQVSVQISNDVITGITVISHNDTQGICDRAIEEMPGKIISSQSTSVDVVSGASYTSKGIINAVNDALSKA